jgi:hypothetical protein
MVWGHKSSFDQASFIGGGDGSPSRPRSPRRGDPTKIRFAPEQCLLLPYIVASHFLCRMILGNFTALLPDSAKFCAESVRESSVVALSLVKKAARNGLVGIFKYQKPHLRNFLDREIRQIREKSGFFAHSGFTRFHILACILRFRISCGTCSSLALSGEDLGDK